MPPIQYWTKRTKVDSQITIKEYVAKYGGTVESVRKRLQRGTLAGHQVDGQWYIDIRADQDKKQGSRTGNGRTGKDTEMELLLARQKIEFQEREISLLKEQIERLEAEVQRQQLTNTQQAEWAVRLFDAPMIQPCIPFEPEKERNAEEILADLATLSKKEKKAAIATLPKKERETLLRLLKKK